MRVLSENTPIVVEGKRDAEALRRLGITKNITKLNRGESVVVFCERLAMEYRHVTVLTDWDRRGGQLGRKLATALAANGVKVDTETRARIVILSKKEIKDIEGLPGFIERLRNYVSGQARRHNVESKRI